MTLYPPTGKINVNVRRRTRRRTRARVWLSRLKGWPLTSHTSACGASRNNGDVPPQWTIAGPKGMLRQPRGVTLDAKTQDAHRQRQVPERRLDLFLPGVVRRDTVASPRNGPRERAVARRLSLRDRGGRAAARGLQPPRRRSGPRNAVSGFRAPGIVRSAASAGPVTQRSLHPLFATSHGGRRDTTWR